MSELVNELLTEHADITDALLKIQRVGVHTEQGRKLLLLARENLLSHLEKEDVDLYPVLWKAAESDENLKNMLEKYARDMEHISAKTLAFFEEYGSASVGGNFEKECKALIRMLCKRISNEESVLYQKYNEIMR